MIDVGKKKLKQFLENNFPPYNSYEVLQETDDKIVAVLNYGVKDKIRVTIGYADDGYNLLKLLQTDFI